LIDGLIIGAAVIPAGLLVGYVVGCIIGWIWNLIEDWRDR